MQGITIKELCELISQYHDVEFKYGRATYVMQPEVIDDKNYLVIKDITSKAAKCIAKREIGVDGDVSQEIFNSIFLEKCFNGYSFLEIESSITVTAIY